MALAFSKINYPPALLSYIQNALGMAFLGEIQFLVGAFSGNDGFRQELAKWGVPDAHMHATPALAEAALVGDRNDVLVVMPGSHAQTAVLTWDNSYTHMLGMSPTTRAGANRTRLGHSGYAMANMFTLSSTSAMIKDMYWMHGASDGGAADVTTWTVSGSRNVMDGCNAASPMDASQAASANFKQVKLTGSQNYFKGCTFGVSNALRRTTDSDNLSIEGGTHNVFEDSIFICNAAAATPQFINFVTAVTGARCSCIFLNCQFINTGRKDIYPMTVGVTTTPTIADENLLYFDNRCTFFGVTDVIANGNEGIIAWGAQGAPSGVSAFGDRLQLGVGQNPDAD